MLARNNQARRTCEQGRTGAMLAGGGDDACNEARPFLQKRSEGAGGGVQGWTFVFSLGLQLANLLFALGVLVASSVAQANGVKTPEVLTTIFVLETVVQLVEFVWYATIAFRFRYRCESFGVFWRYLDWWFSTPTMLLTLLFFVRYLADPCVTNKELREEPSFVGFVILIILGDWIMLLAGLSIELRTDMGPFKNSAVAKRFSAAGRTFPTFTLLFGTLLLVAAFVPHFVYSLSENHFHTSEGAGTVFATLAVWVCYGVVAWWWMDEASDLKDGVHTTKEQTRNAFYNILDLVSKNVFGVVVSIIAIHWMDEDFSKRVCPELY